MQEGRRRRLSSCFLQHPVCGCLSETGRVQTIGGEAEFAEHTEIALVEAEQGELCGDCDSKRGAELHNLLCDPVGAAEESGICRRRLQEVPDLTPHLFGRQIRRQKQQEIPGEGEPLLPQYAEKSGEPQGFLGDIGMKDPDQPLRMASPQELYRLPHASVFIRGKARKGEIFVAAVQKENRRAGMRETFIEVEIRIFQEPEGVRKNSAEAAAETMRRENSPLLEEIRPGIEDLEPEAPLPEIVPKRMNERRMGIVVRLLQQQRDPVFPFCRREPAEEAAAALNAAEIALLRERLQGGAHGSPAAPVAKRQLSLRREAIAPLLKIFRNFRSKLGKQSFCFVHFGKRAGYFSLHGTGGVKICEFFGKNRERRR